MQLSSKFLVTAMFASALLLCNTAFAAIDDMVNYWTFDDGTGRSVSDHIGGQNGVMTGSSTGFGWASGKSGTALAMDGLQGQGIALPNGILKGSNGSLSVWFNMQDMTDRNIIFSGKSISDHNIYAAVSVDRDGRPLFQSRDTATGNDRKAQGGKLLNRNEWYNLVITANTLGYHMYVNGEEIPVAGDNIGRWFPDITNQTFLYRIGTLDAIPMNGSWNGYLDDLRIYDRALSLAEVAELYNIGNDAKTALPGAIAPKISLSISEDRIPYGGSVALRWSAEKVDTCTASGDWNGSVPLSGERVFVKLASDASYTLSCTSANGSVSSTVKASVSGDGKASSSISVSAQSNSSLVVTSVPTSGQQPVVAPSVSKERQAAVEALIKQILALIAELQKQLAQMKAAGATMTPAP